jgi:hypothetical protein
MTAEGAMTPEERMQDAQVAAEAALEQLARAKQQYYQAFKELSKVAYAHGGVLAQFTVGTRHGAGTFERRLVRTMRRLRLGKVLDVARTR